MIRRPPRPTPFPYPTPSRALEGAAIALNLGTSVNGLAGDGNALASVVLSAIPLGAVLSDGTHTITANPANTLHALHSCDLARLIITPTSAANFTLTVTATAR